jgi:hypothetical protein
MFSTISQVIHSQAVAANAIVKAPRALHHCFKFKHSKNLSHIPGAWDFAQSLDLVYIVLYYWRVVADLTTLCILARGLLTGDLHFGFTVMKPEYYVLSIL